jgi:putative ABC transport system permease protein
MPAYQASDAPDTEDYTWALPKAFISPEAAAAHGWGLHAESVAITYPAPSDLDAVRTAVEDAGMDLYASESADEYVTGLYFLLAGLAALVAFLGAGVTVALSATDGRADLATLSALGAQPRRRRTLAGAHALVVTGLGAFAGLVLGVCAGFAAVPIVGYWHLSVPWQHLLITVLAVPLLASVVAVVATPSRLVPRS